MREKRQRIVKDNNSGSRNSDNTYGKRTFKKGDNTPPPSRDSKPRAEGNRFGSDDRPKFDRPSTPFSKDFKPKFDRSANSDSDEKPNYGRGSTSSFNKDFKPKFDRSTKSNFGDKPNFKSNSTSGSDRGFNSRRTSSSASEKSFSNFFQDDDKKDSKTPNGRNWTFKERKQEAADRDKAKSKDEKPPFRKSIDGANERAERSSFKPRTSGSFENKPSGYFKDKEPRKFDDKPSTKTPFKSSRAPKDDYDKFDDDFDYDNFTGFSDDGKSGYQRNNKTDEKAPRRIASPFAEKRSYTPKTYAKKTTDNVLSKQHDDGLVRLNKYISNAGICSRREADELIQTGVIKVNGKIITDLGVRISPTDIVLMEGQKISQEKKVYILVNKPKDFITTVDDPQERKTVMNLVKDACKERVYPVGRLDRNTTGVLLLTNDGELTKKLTHPKYEKSKMYHVFLDKPLTKAHFELIEQGIELEDGLVKVDAIDYVAKAANFDEVGVELHSGRNRIVRRIFESLDYRVVKLDRVMFAGLTKKDLPRGRWRFLTPAEITMLYGN